MHRWTFHYIPPGKTGGNKRTVNIRGSGKSSVVFAGLIPKLRKAGSGLIESFRPNKQPFYELAAALISQLEPELGKTDKTIKAKELAELD